jgi:hypothetical protein
LAERQWQGLENQAGAGAWLKAVGEYDREEAEVDSQAEGGGACANRHTMNRPTPHAPLDSKSEKPIQNRPAKGDEWEEVKV